MLLPAVIDDSTIRGKKYRVKRVGLLRLAQLQNLLNCFGKLTGTFSLVILLPRR